MKKIYLLVIGLCFVVILKAQVSKTVELTAGNLSTLITSTEQNTVTQLIITGTMDARDFKFMRDSMPVLAEIDMSNATVERYEGIEGTMSDVWSFEYPANKVPAYAFCDSKTYTGKTTLISVKLPQVRAVLYNSFLGCTNLQTVVFPPTVTRIGEAAFNNCTSLVNMELPPFLNYIERHVFRNCTSLASITLPSSLLEVGSVAFDNCSGLRAIHIITTIPYDFVNEPDLFRGVDKNKCILYVPYGTQEFYEFENYNWDDFKHIVYADHGFILSSNYLSLDYSSASISEISIKANVNWLAVSDMPWLTLSPSSGNSDATLTISVEENQSTVPRLGTLTFTAEGSPTRIISVEQGANGSVLNVTPGNLSSALDKGERSLITKLVLNGQIDARDFKTIRDELLNVVEIDLSGVTVAPYSGTQGTVTGMHDYPANEVPPYAFYKHTTIWDQKLSQIILPLTVTSIGEFAFTNCYHLAKVEIPSEVAFIGRNAFQNCYFLHEVKLPQALTTIETSLFNNCSIYEALIPSKVTTIKDSAFYVCHFLNKVSIPASVNTIGSYAFYNCEPLYDLYALPTTPPDLSQSADVFYEVDKYRCVLHVPIGSEEQYAAANQWKDFKNITVSTLNFHLNATELSVIAENSFNNEIYLFSDVEWQAVSNASWLTVSPASGVGNSNIFISTEANSSSGKRIGTITFSSEGITPIVLNVIQEPGVTTLNITPGSLSSLLNDYEKSHIDSLILTGSIDARDFKTMRDQMPQLMSIELSQVTVVAYNGLEGTAPIEWGAVSYENNSIPVYAFGHPLFHDNNALRSVQIPSAVTTIGISAFEGCASLATINIPSGTTFIGESAFSRCTSLTGPIILPDGIRNIENYTFFRCINLTSIELPAALDSIQPSAFDACFAWTGDLILPSTVRYVGERAFANCRSLNGVLDLPPLLTTIESFAFVDCRSLSSIIVRNPVPVPLFDNFTVFELVNKNIPLKVPVGSKDRYTHSTVWNEFTNIIEDKGIVSASYVSFGPEGGNNNDIILNANVTWTAASDQPWLTVSPSEGNNNNALAITADPNQLVIPRRATILINAEGFSTQAIVVEQGANQGSIAITPGSLASALNEGERSLVTSLTLTGEMDARDFRTIRQELLFLKYLDLEKVNIVAYTDHTYSNNILYPANTIPAFYYQSEMGNHTDYSLGGHWNLNTILLPESLKDIGKSAFLGCYGLHSVKLQPSLEMIEDEAFAFCAFLDSISLPSNITHIGKYAFHGCSRMVNIDLKANITAISEGAFTECRAITTIDIPESVTSIEENAFLGCDLLQTIVIPPAVSKIGKTAFSSCFNLSSVIIPSSVSMIDSGAFYDCTSLHEIYAFPAIPPDLTDSPQVFFNVDYSNAILYVPVGSKALYASADQWKDFINIVEIETDQMRLNESYMIALPTATKEVKQSVHFKCYPNPFARQMFIEIENPLLNEVTAEIFSISGQKIKTLIRAQKGVKSSIEWNGNDEHGKQVSPGIYLLKVNGEVKKVVKE